MRPRTLVGVLILALALAGEARGADPGVAALQVALRERGLYGGAVDGLDGPRVTEAVRELQRHARLVVDGIAGPQTRRALGGYGRHRLGSRAIRRGQWGWDVAALQFLLATRGFPSGAFDGTFGERMEKAVLRYQRWAGLPADGVVGPATLSSFRSAPPRPQRRLTWPVDGPLGDGFGPRGSGFHAGLDVKAWTGVEVRAAAAGRVAFAGPRGTHGNAVLIAHGKGLRTIYAHLSQVDVALGQRVGAGKRIGLVGATGHATGPHLHFEVRVRGAAIDPLLALP